VAVGSVILGCAAGEVLADGAGLASPGDARFESLFVRGSFPGLPAAPEEGSAPQVGESAAPDTAKSADSDAVPAGVQSGVPTGIVPVDSLDRAFELADSLAMEASRDSVGGPTDGSRRGPREIEKAPNEAWTTIRSGIVPGWGQLVNRKPLKAGLFFGAWALFGVQALVAESDRRDAQEAFDLSGSVSDMDAVNDAVDRRNSRLWWMGGVAIFSMLDAYVDVHFWGFEEQWKARVQATGVGEGRVSVGMRF
jgi:hypothetical protein